MLNKINWWCALDRASFNQGKGAKFDFQIIEGGVQPTMTSKGPGAVAYGVDCYNMTTTGNKTQTITCSATDSNHVPCVMENKPLGLSMQSSAGFGAIQEDKMTTLIIGDNPGWQNGVCYWDGSQTAGTLTANNANGSQRMPDKDNFNCVMENKTHYIVRRLTPLECERLQGFPDGWTDIGEWVDSKGKTHKPADSNRYKALGNSIALPSWRWVLKRLCGNYERPATMASLFDGIGGFPLIWESINGKGSCLWASEIEEFPIAVTERRINV